VIRQLGTLQPSNYRRVPEVSLVRGGRPFTGSSWASLQLSPSCEWLLLAILVSLKRPLTTVFYRSCGDSQLVRWGFIVWLVEKFAYREIDQVRPAVKRSVLTRRHYEQLRMRQSAKYLGVLLNRCEVVIARHH